MNTPPAAPIPPASDAAPLVPTAAGSVPPGAAPAADSTVTRTAPAALASAPAAGEATTQMLAAGTPAARAPLVPGKPLPAAYRHLQLPGFHLLSLLGQGGMAVVFLARQERLNRLVALKMLPTQWVADPAFLQRLEREAVTLANLTHPHIVGCHDILRAESGTFLVLDYVPGATSVRQVISHYDKLPEALAFTIVLQAARGLAYAHAQGIIHRDVKPDNLLLFHEFAELPATADELFAAPQTRVMLADFGLAKGAAAAAHLNEVTSPGLMVGSPAYMAPEQAAGGEVDCRADIYALGATLYHLLTGKAPFPAETALATIAAKLHRDLPLLSQCGVTASPACQAILSRMAARAPADRYPDYASLLATLDAYGSATASSLRVSERAAQAQLATLTGLPANPRRGARRWLVGSLLVLALATLAGVLWLARRPHDLSQSLAYWQGDVGAWQLSYPDDENHREKVLTALAPNHPLTLTQALPANSQLLANLRLPGDGVLLLTLGHKGAPAWQLEWSRTQSASMFTVIVKGQRQPLPVASDTQPWTWHQVELRLLSEEVVLYVDGELAGHQVLPVPAADYALTFTLTEGMLAQVRHVHAGTAHGGE